MNETKEVLNVDVEDIIPNRFQPRLNFDEKGINELALSIKQHGIIQPLIVRRLGNKYEIIAGERRYKASVTIGLKKIPVIITDVDDNKSAEMAVVENIQRKDMSPLEEAKSFEKILKSKQITQEELAIRMGKSQGLIANKLRLLNLSEEAQEALLYQKISERHARSLLQIKNVETQKEILKEIIEKKLNVKLTEKLISQKNEENINDEETNNQEFKENKRNINSIKIEEKEYNPQLEILYNLNKQKEENLNVEEPIIPAFKENLENINIEKPEVNIDNLLKGEYKPEIIEKEQKNKFINDNEFSDDLFDMTDYKIPKKDINKEVELIKTNINIIKNKGINISYEEESLEDNYKITIKIEK